MSQPFERAAQQPQADITRESPNRDLNSTNIDAVKLLPASFVTSETSQVSMQIDLDVEEPRGTNSKLKAFMCLPCVYASMMLQPGSLQSSVFALVVLCLGSGTLTFPYIFYVNGPAMAIGIIVFGAAVSTYTGYLITRCAEKCNARRYEDIALKTYGRRCATFTSIMMLLTMMGFVIAYMVLLKTLLPTTLHTVMNKDLPHWLDDSSAGQHFWVILFSYAVVMPMSIARQLSALRFASLFSFICGIYVVLVIVCVCLCDREVTPDLQKSIETAATKSNMTMTGILTSFPLVVFSFMYQPNLPMVYHELRPSTSNNMIKVLLYATSIAVVCYILAGFFGYATFADYPNVDSIMKAQNIFEAPYQNNGFIIAAMFMLLTGVILATPLCLLPCKDTIEELYLGQSRVMNAFENIIVTLGLVTVCCILAVAIPNIGDAMTVIGATSNPVVGFVLPVWFWLAIDKSARWHPKRIFAHLVSILIICVGIMSLSLFVIDKLNAEDQA